MAQMSIVLMFVESISQSYLIMMEAYWLSILRERKGVKILFGKDLNSFGKLVPLPCYNFIDLISVQIRCLSRIFLSM